MKKLLYAPSLYSIKVITGSVILLVVSLVTLLELVHEKFKEKE